MSSTTAVMEDSPWIGQREQALQSENATVVLKRSGRFRRPPNRNNC